MPEDLTAEIQNQQKTYEAGEKIYFTPAYNRHSISYLSDGALSVPVVEGRDIKTGQKIRISFPFNKGDESLKDIEGNFSDVRAPLILTAAGQEGTLRYGGGLYGDSEMRTTTVCSADISSCSITEFTGRLGTSHENNQLKTVLISDDGREMEVPPTSTSYLSGYQNGDLLATSHAADIDGHLVFWYAGVGMGGGRHPFIPVAEPLRLQPTALRKLPVLERTAYTELPPDQSMMLQTVVAEGPRKGARIAFMVNASQVTEIKAAYADFKGRAKQQPTIQPKAEIRPTVNAPRDIWGRSRTVVPEYKGIREAEAALRGEPVQRHDRAKKKIPPSGTFHHRPKGDLQQMLDNLPGAEIDFSGSFALLAENTLGSGRRTNDGIRLYQAKGFQAGAAPGG